MLGRAQFRVVPGRAEPPERGECGAGPGALPTGGGLLTGPSAGPLSAAHRALAAPPRSPHGPSGSEATAARGDPRAGRPRCCASRGSRVGAGNAVEEQGGRGGCCSPALRARNEPLPPHRAGERLCSSKAPGRWDRLALLRPKGRCLMTQGEIRPAPCGEAGSDGLCLLFHWKCAVLSRLGAPAIPVCRPGLVAVRSKSMGTFLLTGVKHLVWFLFL